MRGQESGAKKEVPRLECKSIGARSGKWMMRGNRMTWIYRRMPSRSISRYPRAPAFGRLRSILPTILQRFGGGQPCVRSKQARASVTHNTRRRESRLALSSGACFVSRDSLRNRDRALCAAPQGQCGEGTKYAGHQASRWLRARDRQRSHGRKGISMENRKWPNFQIRTNSTACSAR